MCSTGGTSAVVVLQRVEGVRIGGDDAVRARGSDGLGVVSAQRLEQGLLAEAPNVVAAVALCGAENPEIHARAAEDAGCGAADRLHPIVIRSDAVDEIQCLAVLVSPSTT